MNPTTLYMDTDNPRRNRLFWIFQSGLSLLWIVQGAFGISQPPDKLSWFPWIQLLGGSFIVVSLVGYLILLKKDGRPRIVLDAEGLGIKSKLRERAKRIPWKSISNISFGTHDLEINTEGRECGLTRFPLKGTYLLNQQIRQSVRDHAARQKGDVIG